MEFFSWPWALGTSLKSWKQLNPLISLSFFNFHISPPWAHLKEHWDQPIYTLKAKLSSIWQIWENGLGVAFFMACLNIRWQKGLWKKKKKINSSPWTQGGVAGREKALLAQSLHFPFLYYFSLKMLGENLLPAFPQSCLVFCLVHGLDQGPHASEKLGLRLRPLLLAFPKHSTSADLSCLESSPAGTLHVSYA